MERNKNYVRGGNYSGLLTFGMLSKKYCCNCGCKLSIKRIKYRKIYKGVLLTSVDHHTEWCYYCECCNYYIGYRNQKKIAKFQKQTQNKKISEGVKIIEQYKMNLRKDGKNFYLDE